MHAQLGQVGGQPAQPRDHPARQHAAGAAQYQWAIVRAPLQGLPALAQLVERGGGGLLQLLSGRRRAEPAPGFFQQALAQCLLQYLQLAADRAMGDMQFGRGGAHAAQADRGFEGA